MDISNIHHFYKKCQLYYCLLTALSQNMAFKPLVHNVVHIINWGAEQLCKNDLLKEQILKMSQLRDDQCVPENLVSSASIANLQTFKHPSWLMTFPWGLPW